VITKLLQDCKSPVKVQTADAETKNEGEKENSTDVKSLMEKYTLLMKEGHTSFYKEDYNTATDKYSEAAALKEEICCLDDKQDQAEVLFHYGSSYLALARLNSSVFGSGKLGNSASAVDANLKLAKGEQSVEPEDDDEEEEAEEEEDYNEAAYDILSLAELAYRKREKSNENQMMVAKCCCALGDWGLENENYQVAIEKSQASIDIYNEVLEDKNDRRIASAYYCIAVGQAELKLYDESKKFFEKAVEVLAAKIKELESQGKKEDALVLGDIIADVKVRLEDLEVTKDPLNEKILEEIKASCMQKMGDKFNVPEIESHSNTKEVKQISVKRPNPAACNEPAKSRRINLATQEDKKD